MARRAQKGRRTLPVALWRWLWAGSVLGVFSLVVAAALDGATVREGELPLIAADPLAVKERVALPAVEDSVPRSSVLNLLAEPDDPSAAAAAAKAPLEAALAAEARRERDVVEIERALGGLMPGEQMPTPARRPQVAALRHSELGFRLEVGAVEPGEEQETFERLQSRHPLLLGDLAPRFQVLSTDDGVRVRVQAGPIPAEAEAETRCRRLREAGASCTVVPTPG